MNTTANAISAISTKTANSTMADNADFRLAMGWLKYTCEQLDSSAVIDDQFDRTPNGDYLVGVKIGEEYLMATFSPNLDEYVLSDVKNEVIEQTTKFIWIVSIGNEPDEQKKERSESKALAKIALEKSLEADVHRTIKQLHLSSVSETDKKTGYIDLVIDPEQIYNRFFDDAFEGLINPDSDQPKDRQFAAFVVAWYHTQVIALFPKLAEKKVGLLWAMSRTDTPLGLAIGMRLQKPKSKKVARTSAFACIVIG